MRRGFKAEAERVAEGVRKEMRLKPADRLDAAVLAAHIGMDVRQADALVDRSKLSALERLQPGAFSACTLTIGTKKFLIVNPLASAGRTQSDIAHEVAHVLLEHRLGEVQQVGGLAFFSCDADEEQEANWLAGCLLLPRPLLLRLAGRGLDAAQIAQECGVSEPMAAFRLRATGIFRQLKSTV